MSARSTAEAFGLVFKTLAKRKKQTQAPDEVDAVAKLIFRLMRKTNIAAFDFSPDQMDCDKALKALGLQTSEKA